MNTGLTDVEKESLLKELLVNLNVEVCYTCESNTPSYKVTWVGGEVVYEGLLRPFGELLIKAMCNLRGLN